MMSGKAARVMTAVVAVAAIAAFAASIVVIKQSNRIDSIERKIGAGSIDQVAILADRDSHNRHYTLISDDKSVRLDGVLTPKGAAFIIGGDLKDVAQHHSYQLWADGPTGAVSLGLLGRDGTKAFAFRMPQGATRLYVTDEVDSGAIAPSPVVVVTGTVPGWS